MLKYKQIKYNPVQKYILKQTNLISNAYKLYILFNNASNHTFNQLIRLIINIWMTFQVQVFGNSKVFIINGHP